MNYLLDPAACPNCGEPLQLAYSERRFTRLQPLAILLRALILITFIIMTPTLWLIAREFIAFATFDMDLRWREQGMMFLIVFVIAEVAMYLLARMSWRYTSSLPRRTRTTCQACGWNGACEVSEVWT